MLLLLLAGIIFDDYYHLGFIAQKLTGSGVKIVILSTENDQ